MLVRLSRTRTCSPASTGLRLLLPRRCRWAILRGDELSVQTPVQIAWVTHDLDATETALTGLFGAKKWVRMPAVHFAPDTCMYRGAPADFVANISLSYLGDMQLELIEPVSGDRVYRDFLAATPDRGCTISAYAPAPGELRRRAGGRGDARRRSRHAGCDARRLGFAYLSAPAAGVPFSRSPSSPRHAGLLRPHQAGASVSTEIPPTVSAGEVTSWSDEVDVVVVGFGIAGGCAAVSAAAAGAQVLVLERAAAAGGTTSMAGGHFYLGGGTAVQQATGHDDSADEMYKYLVAVSREPEHDKIRAYCDGSVEHFNWLEDLGFQFERSYYPGKVVVPPGTEGLSYTGNEKVWPFYRAGHAGAARPLGAGAR